MTLDFVFAILCKVTTSVLPWDSPNPDPVPYVYVVLYIREGNSRMIETGKEGVRQKRTESQCKWPPRVSTPLIAQSCKTLFQEAMEMIINTARWEGVIRNPLFHLLFIKVLLSGTLIHPEFLVRYT